jgi:hypothetical protein
VPRAHRHGHLSNLSVPFARALCVTSCCGAWSSHCRNQTAADLSFFLSCIYADCDLPVPYISGSRLNSTKTRKRAAARHENKKDVTGGCSNGAAACIMYCRTCVWLLALCCVHHAVLHHLCTSASPVCVAFSLVHLLLRRFISLPSLEFGGNTTDSTGAGSHHLRIHALCTS